MSYDLLEDIKVVELSMYAFAPSASAVLADWGADVIKVVPPQVADPMMGTPIAGLPQVDVGVAFMWEILNRGKRCMGTDMGTEDGRQVLLELVERADVFVTNLLPKARGRMKIDPDDLCAVNLRLIYARATGHGAAGPEHDAGGFDHTDFWARSGIGHAASMVSDEFVPQPGPAMGDLSPAHFSPGRSPRRSTGAPARARARLSTCRSSPLECGWPRRRSWRVSSTTSTPFRACVTPISRIRSSRPTPPGMAGRSTSPAS